MNCRSAVVAGGGVVGLSIALRLLRAGVTTTIVAPSGIAAPPSWGNAGHLATEQVEPFASRKLMLKAMSGILTGSGPVRLPLREARHWLPFLLRVARASGAARFRAGTAALASCMREAAPAWRTLLKQVGHPEYLIEQGHYIIWESPRSARRGMSEWRNRDLGPAHMSSASSAELQDLRALVGRSIHAAARFDGTGQFADPGALLDTLEQATAAAGCPRVAGKVERIVRKAGGRAVLRTEDGMEYDADAVVIAAGTGSAALLKPVGLTVPLIAERGYHIQAPPDAWPESHPPLVFEDRSVIVTRFTSALRVCGFVEFAGAGCPADESRWRVLESHAAALGLPFAQTVTRWMGARPTLPDYLPAIGRAPNMNNLFYAFGHQHLGLTLAAVTAELVADLIAGERSAVDLRPFDVTRF